MNGPRIGSEIAFGDASKQQLLRGIVQCKRPMGEDWQVWAKLEDGRIVSAFVGAADLEGRRPVMLGPVDLNHAHQIALAELEGRRSPYSVAETTRLLAAAVLHFTNNPKGAVK